MKTKKLLFSITKKDFDIQPFKSSGPGGQNKNKTMSAIRIYHRPSETHSIATRSRQQKDNLKEAFITLINKDKFKSWLKIKVAKVQGNKTVDEIVEELMRPENLIILYGKDIDKYDKYK